MLIGEDFVGLVYRASKNYSVEENECLVSFDVVSLFTSVLVDKALALVLELLASDDSLPSHTRLSISDIKQGLQICLDSTVFSYKKSFVKQTFGTPMRSCISIIANLYMEHIEHTAISLSLRFIAYSSQPLVEVCG